MANGIGAAAAPMEAIGSLLSGAGAQAGPGAAGPDADLQATMGEIRGIGQAVQGLEAKFPALAQEAQQITALLKQMVVKAAQQAQMQTASGMAVPGAGGGA